MSHAGCLGRGVDDPWREGPLGGAMCGWQKTSLRAAAACTCRAPLPPFFPSKAPFRFLFAFACAPPPGLLCHSFSIPSASCCMFPARFTASNSSPAPLPPQPPPFRSSSPLPLLPLPGSFSLFFRSSPPPFFPPCTVYHPHALPAPTRQLRFLLALGARWLPFSLLRYVMYVM